MAENINHLPLFVTSKPAQIRVPFLFNSPHSGRVYPIEFMDESVLEPAQLRLSEDAFVDLLFQDVVSIGAVFLAVNFPRAFVDVNRDAYELETSHINDVPQGFSALSTLRAKAGLGVVPTIVTMDKPIYSKKLNFQDVIDRINQYYFPYHHTLDVELLNIEKQFGYSVLIDCHSMPSHLKFFDGIKQPDIILGDNNGLSCAPELILRAAELLTEKGYDVVCNQPYSGGFITKHHGRPFQNRHVLQIEINRALYMDERLIELHQGFQQLHNDIMSICADLISLPDHSFICFQNAAE